MKREERNSFYALYWGQNCLEHKETGAKKAINSLCDIADAEYILTLRSIESLTIGDAKNLAEIMGLNQQQSLNAKAASMIHLDIQKVISTVKDFSRMSLPVADYLRQNRFALPWNGWSIEKMVKHEIIKIAE